MSGRFLGVTNMKSTILLIVILVSSAIAVAAQTTEFTYQGSLTSAGNPASGNHDFEFRLFSVDTGGSAISTLQRLNVPVVSGVFSVKLDFGVQFPGANRYLEIGVRPAGGGSFTTLSPRQLVNSAPYSVRSLNAVNADNATQLGGFAATGFIQNTTGQQPTSNFNISGNGNIGGRLRVEGIPSGSLASFGGSGSFQIDANGMTGGRLAVIENGNVGIGTSAPAAKLHVSGAGIVRTRVNSDSNAGLGLALNDQPKWSVATVTGGQFQIFNDALGQNALWINSSDNNVGIGTTSPAGKFHVSQSTSALRFSNESGVSALRVENSAVDSRSFISLGDDATAWQLRIDGPTPNPQNFFDNFSIQNASTGQVALTICCKDTPRVGIGMTNPIVTFEVKPGGGALADFWNTRSSIKLKENILPIKSALNKVLSLRGVSFDYKDSKKHSLGFIAEEVQAVLPEVVQFAPNSTDALGLDYSRITPVVVEAVKEQQAEIKRQQRLIEQQQQQIDELRRLVCASNRRAAICKRK